MQPLHWDLLPEGQQTNRLTHTWTTHEQNSMQNTVEELITPRFERSRTRRTHEVPFIAGGSHFTRKNTRFRAPASRQTQAP